MRTKAVPETTNAVSPLDIDAVIPHLVHALGGGGTRQERQQGLVYLNAGTKVGNATACYLVALAYRDGGLTKKNPQAAMRLLKRAVTARRRSRWPI